MIRIILIIVTFLIYSVANGSTLELGIPVKSFKGNSISVIEWTALEKKNCSPVCSYWGGQLAHAELKNGESVNFFGIIRYFELRGGGYWTRLGFGWGLFNHRTENIRTSWDFNISNQFGYDFLGDWGGYVGFEHWSNGRSFAERLGLGDLWPEYNDGGNQFMFGVRHYW